MGNKIQFWMSLMVVFLVVACNANDTGQEEIGAASTQAQEITASDQSSKSSPQELRQSIDTLIGANRQCAVDTDCKLVGLGARPCGGPDEYRVYSNVNGVEGKLLAMVEKYNAMAKKDNESSGRLGICVVAPKPLFSCVNNLCQTDNVAANADQI